MRINDKKVITNGYFAYDGCHKIYVLEDMQDRINAKENGYSILPINKLKETFKNSCELRFIRNWKLNILYVGQFEKATFKKSE